MTARSNAAGSPAFIESPGWFDCEGDRLLGMLATPAGDAAPASETGVVVVVGGPQYRAGSHRQFVALARQLANEGWPCLRFDVRGMGDSEGAQRSFEALDADIAAAVDHLLACCPTVKRVLLWGLCDGASAALLYVQRRRDRRIGGLVLLNPWVRSSATLARTQVRHYYLDRLRQPAFWRKLLSGQVAGAALAGLVRNLRLARGGGGRGRTADAAMPFQSRMAAGWTDGRLPILLLTSERDLTAQEFLDASASDPAWQRALRENPPRHVVLPGADHTCAVPGTQALAEQAMLQWLRTTLPQRPSDPELRHANPS